jgi:pyridoxal/pyridoxine/pyridoxamine kinase
VPKAYMITPNQFEAEKLIESEIKNEKDCLNAI